MQTPAPPCHVQGAGLQALHTQLWGEVQCAPPLTSTAGAPALPGPPLTCTAELQGAASFREARMQGGSARRAAPHLAGGHTTAPAYPPTYTPTHTTQTYTLHAPSTRLRDTTTHTRTCLRTYGTDGKLGLAPQPTQLNTTGYRSNISGPLAGASARAPLAPVRQGTDWGAADFSWDPLTLTSVSRAITLNSVVFTGLLWGQRSHSECS